MEFPTLGRHNERLKLFRSLDTSSARERAGAFLVEGVRVVEELLKSSLSIRALLYSDRSTSEVFALARASYECGAEVFMVEHRLLEQLSPTKTSQGLLALAELPSFDWDDIVNSHRLVILEGIQDPGNVGTLLRSARAFGFTGALCLGGADPFNARAVRSAAGATFALPILRFADGKFDWAERLKRSGYDLVTAVAHGGIELAEAVFPERFALVLGGEVSGISHKTSSLALEEITIPLAGNCESLNVGVAGAVLMYESYRRFLKSK